VNFSLGFHGQTGALWAQMVPAGANKKALLAPSCKKVQELQKNCIFTKKSKHTLPNYKDLAFAFQSELLSIHLLLIISEYTRFW